MKQSKTWKVVKVVVATVVGIAALALLVIGIVRPEPAEVDPNVVISRGLNYFVRPGFWQGGEVVTTPVTDWSFVRSFRSIVLETRSPYFIPHAVRVTPIVKNNMVYIPSGQYRMERGYPDRLWAANVYRDPRVRLKMGGKLYDMTLVLITNRAEAEAVFGRNPEMWIKDENGQEKQVGYTHLYRAFQRRIVEFGSTTLPRNYTGLPRPNIGQRPAESAPAPTQPATPPPPQ